MKRKTYNKKAIEYTEVRQICSERQIEIKELKSLTGSFGKKIFFINNELLLRVSETSMAHEQEKFRRVSALHFVPKIIYAGTLDRDAAPVFYTFLTLLPGDDFVNAYPDTTLAQQKQLGKDVAGFLDNLHELNGTQYDIGLYIPALPGFSGTWRDGHQLYWKLLEQGTEKLDLKQDSVQVTERAYRYLKASIGCLDSQTGPKLLHNDFHPKNTLLNKGKFSGAIDWECSQYGEADFDLCHWFHWCLYPPDSSLDFRPFLRAFFEAGPKCTRVPNLVQRLTIYQIEHELQQVIWGGSEAESWRVPRLVHWLNGAVDDLFREIAT